MSYLFIPLLGAISFSTANYVQILDISGALFIFFFFPGTGKPAFYIGVTVNELSIGKAMHPSENPGYI